MEIGSAIARYSGEPATEARGISQGVEARQRLQENVLNEIFHRGMWHAAEKNAVNHASVASVQLAEGAAVTLLGGFDERILFAGSGWWRCTGQKRRSHLGFESHVDAIPLLRYVSSL